MTVLRFLTTLIYGTTYMLGLGIALKWWNTRTIHWLHHTLFAAIWVSTIATALAGWYTQARAWAAPLAVLLWMAPLPLFRAGGRMHHVLANGGLVTLIASLVASRGTPPAGDNR
jgi:uncharacterized membrane protein